MNTAGDLVPRGPPKKQVGKFMGVKKGPPAAPKGAKKTPPSTTPKPSLKIPKKQPA